MKGSDLGLGIYIAESRCTVLARGQNLADDFMCEVIGEHIFMPFFPVSRQGGSFSTVALGSWKLDSG